MKKIKLNESDLLKIVKRVLNEQKIRQFDEDEIDLLHFIFERELKPPFRKGGRDSYGYCPYYNRDNEWIGQLDAYDDFVLFYNPFMNSIHLKVCTAFGFPYDAGGWGALIEPHLKPWMDAQLNIKIRHIRK